MSGRIEKIDPSNPDKGVLEHAARLIKKGEVLVCPTDTGYAFSVNALNARAVARVFSLKGRSFSNPIHIAVSSIVEAEKYALVNETARLLARQYLPGALTLVLPRKQVIPAILIAGRDTVGIRIPDNKVILNLTAMTGLPLTTTSANTTGRPTPFDVKDIIREMGENIRKVAMVLDQGPLATHEVSTVVDLSVSPPQLIRQGLVSWLEIHEFLSSISRSRQIPE